MTWKKKWMCKDAQVKEFNKNWKCCMGHGWVMGHVSDSDG
jgi:hypothetical protein